MLSAIWRVVWDATWGNNMATVEVGALAAVGGYLGRHRIGSRLGAWLGKHIASHL
jgi:hypothetical protein